MDKAEKKLLKIYGKIFNNKPLDKSEKVLVFQALRAQYDMLSYLNDCVICEIRDNNGYTEIANMKDFIAEELRNECD